MDIQLIELRHRLSNELETVNLQLDIDSVKKTLRDWKDMQIHLNNAERAYNIASTDQERYYTRQYLNSILSHSNSLDESVKVFINEMNTHYSFE